MPNVQSNRKNRVYMSAKFLFHYNSATQHTVDVILCRCCYLFQLLSSGSTAATFWQHHLIAYWTPHNLVTCN